MSARMRRSVAVSASFLIICGSLVGCSSDSEPDSGATPSAGGGASAGATPDSEGSPAPAPVVDPTTTVSGKVTLTGAETTDGDFTNDTWTVQPSCQDAVANGSGGGGFGPDGAFLIPGPYPDGSVLSDGTQYVTSVQIDPDKYTGAGSYTQVSGGMQVGGQEAGYYYDFELAGTVTATVKEDGAGSLEFTGVPAKTAPAQMISGSVTWTCGGS